jgi:hypothetical protein
MPTPFNHLRLAYDLQPLLSPGWRARVGADWPAFLLGNIAPDVQTVSGQTREATHFFSVPLAASPPAVESLLRHYPELARPARLPAAQGAFLAGYLAHLEFDVEWVRAIFEPVFGPDQTWGSFRERIYLHNALRAHWDATDLAALPAGVGAALARARPAGWLPFVADAHLENWRDQVAEQLHTDGQAATIRVFAERMGVEPDAFRGLVESPEAMAARVFSRASAAQLAAYRAGTLLHTAARLEAYWAGALGR